MKLRSRSKGADLLHLEAEGTNNDKNDGLPAIWYQSSIRSASVERAFLENEHLGFAEEAKWTPQSLQNSGAFGDIIKTVLEIVKQMDGVGVWCTNNYQPSHTETQRRRRASPESESYW
ncbi:hypothetical protein BX600DRAFT_452409 [Xylariales sp. PMI_506]|nr:hypothetical protein BX600DRAFT_452409 [Xylariales sp. PMI_506]